MELITLIGLVALIVAIVRNTIGAYKDWREINNKNQQREQPNTQKDRDQPS